MKDSLRPSKSRPNYAQWIFHSFRASNLFSVYETNLIANLISFVKQTTQWLSISLKRSCKGYFVFCISVVHIQCTKSKWPPAWTGMPSSLLLAVLILYFNKELAGIPFPLGNGQISFELYHQWVNIFKTQVSRLISLSAPIWPRRQLIRTTVLS